MPANLNALIRYKTIDNCLRNKLSYWTIEKLQEECREACGEYRGLYKISERTIRDDIRVMRSEILGFNAPIACKNGCYEYSDPNYTIFDVPVKKTMGVIEKTRAFLIENKDLLGSSEVDEIIEELANVNQGSIVTSIKFSYAPQPHSSSQGHEEPKTVRENHGTNHEGGKRDVESGRRDTCWGRIFDLL